MTLLKTIKRSLVATKGFGVSSLISTCEWRRQRLLILCYHGIGVNQESDSHPEMFLPPEIFERRMQSLKQSGANVLPLCEALPLLRSGQLPPRSVLITFDDGWADFVVNAYPVLKRFGFPATVYLTTYYSIFNRPIFRFALEHMMWKRRNQVIETREIPWLPELLDLRTAGNRARLVRLLDNRAKVQSLSGRQKDELAAKFASIIGFDYEKLTRDRLFHLMNPEEVASIARHGVDVQLHTHRHRAPVDREQFIAEIVDNRRITEELTGKGGRVHFCYPSGATRPDFLRWLQEAGVESATTCNLGLATRTTYRWLLPRLLDQVNLNEHEFEAWVTGFAAFLPKRKVVAPDVAPE